jgi:pimeloyl-ACP methyl ester carboxylesterase
VATLTLDDLDLYYELRGEGPELLFLNGSGGSIDSAGPLIDRLAACFTIAVHDQRGLGKTSVPPTEPSMADYANDAAALPDHLGWTSARVFGISFGGMVAQELAVSRPDRIDRLALLCTSAGGGGGSSYPLHVLAGLPAHERAAIATANMDSRFTPAFLDAHPRERSWVEARFAPPAEPKNAERLRGEAMQLAARANHDVWDRLDRVTAPTIVAGGIYDGQAPMANSVAISLRIKESVLRTYDGGHLFVFQDRRALPEITAFLQGPLAWAEALKAPART